MTDPLLIAALGTLAVIFIVMAWWLPEYRRNRNIGRRLRAFVVQDPIESGPRTASEASRVPRSRWTVSLERLVGQAKVDLTVDELGLTMLVFACGTTALAFALPGATNVLIGLIAAPVGALIPVQWLRVRAARIQKKFREQLPDTVVLLANSLSAGLSFPQAIQHVVRDSPEPTRGAFEVVGRELSLGSPQDAALDRLALKYRSEELTLVVAAVNVHQQIGGNLPRMLDVIASTVRERQRIAGDVSVLTSQGRYSAYILAGLPVVVAGGISLIMPDYLAVMFEYGPTRLALVAAVLLVLAGFFTMRRMGAVDV